MVKTSHRSKTRAWLESVSLPHLHSWALWFLSNLFATFIALNLVPRDSLSPVLPSFLPPSLIYFVFIGVTLQFWEFDFAYKLCLWDNPKVSRPTFSSHLLWIPQTVAIESYPAPKRSPCVKPYSAVHVLNQYLLSSCFVQGVGNTTLNKAFQLQLELIREGRYR